MTDEQLIEHCRDVCAHPSGMVTVSEANRMIELAGFPEGLPREVHSLAAFISVHEEMMRLCTLAAAALGRTGPRLRR
jgi:hypothetical protein